MKRFKEQVRQAGVQKTPLTELRKSIETKWITSLTAAYPYSLNDKISDNIKLTNNEIIDLKKF